MQTATISAYTSRKSIAILRVTPALAREQSFFWNFYLFKPSVPALLCLIHAAYYGMSLFTKFLIDVCTAA